ncbi:hypothetical protein WMY93_003182 [Mugilogobius chulae]|uniref:Uncharacterized protein n=1 Tax=Mugilogobius chulae TaxID=88201 RepID=A0AAW0Q1N5_9GOBI
MQQHSTQDRGLTTKGLNSAMSGDGRKEAPPYMVPGECLNSDVKVYNVHTPFTPPESSHTSTSIHRWKQRP